MKGSSRSLIIFVSSCLLIFVLQVEANIGPKTDVVLIPKKKDPSIVNKVGNSMSLEFWVFTDGEGGSFFHMNTFLNADKPPVGATYVWGTALLKYAGTAISYDVGLCTHQFTGDEEINVDQTSETWDILDMWFTRVSPFEQGQNFANLLVSSKDTSQTGTDDYAFSEDAKFRAETIDLSKKIAFNCPLVRYMNTFDYLDVKVEIYQKYDVQGMYYMLNPPGSAEKVSEPDHGYGPTVKIEILDGARQAGVIALGVILATVSLGML